MDFSNGKKHFAFKPTTLICPNYQMHIYLNMNFRKVFVHFIGKTIDLSYKMYLSKL